MRLILRPWRKLWLFAILACLSFSLPASVKADSLTSLFYGNIPIAPGPDSCLNRLDQMEDMEPRMCIEQETKKWGAKLEKKYKEVLAYCDKGPDPALCKKKVRGMQNSWLKYDQQMYDVILKNYPSMGHANTPSTDAAISFDFALTRFQYYWLDQLLDLP